MPKRKQKKQKKRKPHGQSKAEMTSEDCVVQ